MLGLLVSYVVVETELHATVKEFASHVPHQCCSSLDNGCGVAVPPSAADFFVR